MNPERWKEVRELFDQLVALPPEEQEQFLAERCSGDSALAGELRSLLAYDQPGEATQLPGSELADSGSPPRLLRSGQRLGTYRLLREIGRGGMSTVYLGVRDDQHFEQRVAVKVISAGFGSHRELVDRFRQERQILASLDHPNIARLLDGGNTDEGLPYFVMEYIEGLPIDRYCSTHGLSVRQRLELFRRVCAVVQYAHQNLVVHRDLKPSNVLVTQAGEPKLLDFGIAKLLNPQLTKAQVVSTTPTLQVMTAGYASPEQVRGEPISTASDVYSLGVLLYELLAGRLPFSLDGLSPLEVARRVSEEPVPPPSRVAPAPSAPGANPAGQHAPLRIHRDLDAILMMALRKEPARRYGSAEQLSDDLERFLEHRPIRARAESWLSRGWKALRRNPLAAGLGLALLIFAVQMARLADSAERATHQAEALAQQAIEERAEADFERASSEENRELLLEIFRYGDPDSAGDLSVRQILRDREQRALTEQAATPRSQANTFATLSELYRQLGEFEQAIRLSTRALELRRTHLEPGDPQIAESLAELARLRYLEGNFAAAASLQREAREIVEQRYGPSHVRVAEARAALGQYLHAQGQETPGAALIEEALAIYRSHSPRDPRRIGKLLVAKSNLLFWQREFKAAEVPVSQAIVLLREAYGDRHAEVAEALSLQGLLLAYDQRYAEAIPVLEDSLEIRRNAWGSGHHSIAEALTDFGRALNTIGELDDAESYLNEALQITRKLNGGRNAFLGTAAVVLAETLWYQGRFAESLRAAEESIASYEETSGPSHYGILFPLMWKARILRQLDRCTDAIETARRAIGVAQRREQQPAGMPGLRYGLGLCLAREGRLSEAAEALAAARDGWRLEGQTTYAGMAGAEWGRTLVELGQEAEAIPVLLEAQADLDGAEGQDDRRAQVGELLNRAQL